MFRPEGEMQYLPLNHETLIKAIDYCVLFQDYAIYTHKRRKRNPPKSVHPSDRCDRPLRPPSKCDHDELDKLLLFYGQMSEF